MKKEKFKIVKTKTNDIFKLGAFKIIFLTNKAYSLTYGCLIFFIVM